MLRFPKRTDDIRLRRSPLLEVICQVRFPVLLSIVSEQPAAFQEMVRKMCPDLEIEQGVTMTGSEAQPAAQIVRAAVPVYRFKTEDGKTTIALSSSFYAVSTTAYGSWEDFYPFLALAHQAASAVYSISIASRIGLRYINRINKENPNVDSAQQLLEILHPALIPLLNVDAWDLPSEMANQLVIADGEKKLALRCGFRREPLEFVLDLDYFSEGRMSLDDLESVAFRYHEVIYDAFRWCIRDDQLSIFDPAPKGK